MDQDNSNTIAFVGDLSKDVSEVDLLAAFGPHGTVKHVLIKKRTNESLGYGFVRMSTTDERDLVIQHLNNTSLNGRVIHVAKAERNRKLRCDLAIRNIASTVTMSEIIELFSTIGPLNTRETRFYVDNGGDRFARVCYEKRQFAGRARRMLDGECLHDKPMIIEWLNVDDEEPSSAKTIKNSPAPQLCSFISVYVQFSTAEVSS
jgi:RNA recognition motif-containing protein